MFQISLQALFSSIAGKEPKEKTGWCLSPGSELPGDRHHPENWK